MTEKPKRDRDYGPVIVGAGSARRVRYLSVSQLQSFDPHQDGGCNRRWFFRRVLKKPEPTTKAQAGGTDLHLQIKQYLQTGRDALGPVARAGRHFIPEPGLDLVVERDFCPPAIVDADPTCARDQFLAGGVSTPVYQATLRGALTVRTGDDEIPLVGAADLIHRRDHYITTEGARVVMPRNSVEVCDWKALDVDTPMLTPGGWKTMESLVVGDHVFAPDGSPTKVVGVSEIKYDHQPFVVIFDDQTSLVTSGDHLWQVAEKVDSRFKDKAVSTAYIREFLQTHPRKHTSGIAVELPAAIDLIPITLPVDPYVMGAWLGDGCRDSARIAFDPRDDGIQVIEEAVRRGYPVTNLHYHSASVSTYTATFSRLSAELRKNNFLGMRRIPDVYFGGSKEQRADLLRGLLDTDGTCSTRGRVSFCTIHEELAFQVRYLARSLGYKASIASNTRRVGRYEGHVQHQVNWKGFGPTFGMDRKQARIQHQDKPQRTGRRWVRAVVPCTSRNVRCIAVEHPSHLYVAGTDLVVTHNTTSNIAKWAKAPEALIETIQMPGYAELASRMWPDLEYFRVSHGYFQTGRGGRAADKRSAIFDLTVKRRRWYEVENTARALTQVAREDDVRKVEANHSACAAFGGCPHWEYCPRSPAQTIVDLFRRPDFAPRWREKETEMSLLDRIASNGQPAPPQGQPQFAPPQGQPQFAAQGQQPQFAAPQQPAFAPQGQPQPSAALQGQPQPSAALQDEVQCVLADERRIMQERGMAPSSSVPPTPAPYAPPQGQPQAFAPPQGQPQVFAPPQGQPQAFVPPQGQPQVFAPPTPAPYAPPQGQPQAFAPPQGQPQAAPESIGVQSARGPICAACGESLTRENASQLQDGRVLHVRCPRRAAPAVLPPDAPQSGQFQPAAQSIDPLALAALPPPVQQAHQAMFGAPPPPAPRTTSRSGKCDGSGQTVYLQPPEIMGKRATCARCGTANLSIKPEMLGDKAIAKLPSHFDPRAAPQVQQQAMQPQTAAQPAGIDLYVDCVVSGVQQVLSLDAYIDNLARQIEQHFQVPDIRSAQGDHPLAFGRWRAVLSALARESVPSHGAYVVTHVTESEIKQTVVEALRPFCRMFVRAA